MTMLAEREFPGVPASAHSARVFVADLVTDPELRDTAVLAVGELAANAIQHSRSGQPGGTFTVYVEVAHGKEDKTWTYVEVADQGGGAIPLDHHGFSADAIGGRGLGIVRALAAEWGVISGRDGHLVWGRFLGDSA
jgi:serine/threonine-protein kinase RsbW